MSIADTLKGLIFKKPANSADRAIRAARRNPLAGGRRAGEAEPLPGRAPPGTITWAASSRSAKPGR